MASTQNSTLLQHLKTVGSISALEAQAIYKVRSLSSRISELRKSGYAIEAERKVDLTGQRYVRYHLMKKSKRRA